MKKEYDNTFQNKKGCIRILFLWLGVVFILWALFVDVGLDKTGDALSEADHVYDRVVDDSCPVCDSTWVDGLYGSCPLLAIQVRDSRM